MCLALTIGGIAFRLVVLPRDVPRSLERVFWAFALVGPIAAIQIGVVAFLVRAEDALQLPFGRFLYGDLSPFAGSTRFGEAFVVMTLGFAVVTALVYVAWLTERRRALLWPALALSLALAAGLSLSGHSAVDPPVSKWSELADWVHLSAASLWAGGVDHAARRLPDRPRPPAAVVRPLRAPRALPDGPPARGGDLPQHPAAAGAATTCGRQATGTC